ncbi:hypothetical protein ABBQ38_012931 [Trebouxia sp. C0009 RCD-2024]
MAKLSICLAAALTACLAVLAASHFQLIQRDIMRDYSGLPPWFAFTFGFKAFKVLELFPNWAIPPPVRMVDLVLTGLHKSQVIAAINELGVADALGDSGQTAQQLATAFNITDADKLFRLLSAAASFGVLSARKGPKDSPVAFHNNALSAVLRQDHPNTVTHTIKGGMQSLYQPFGLIAEGLRQNKVPFEIAHQKDLWHYLQERPDCQHEFSLAMASQDQMGIHSVLTDFDWSRYSRVVDVGSAYGTFMAAVMQQNSAVSGVVCDLPSVVKQAEQQWRVQYDDDMLQRASFTACDFLQPGRLPMAQGLHEAYVLRDILHDWSDEKSIVILKNIREAMSNNSTAVLLLIESVLQGIIADEDPSVKYLLDITMMVAVDGKERSEHEFVSLLQQTGFRMKTVHQTRGLYRVVEAVPV